MTAPADIPILPPDSIHDSRQVWILVGRWPGTPAWRFIPFARASDPAIPPTDTDIAVFRRRLGLQFPERPLVVFAAGTIEARRLYDGYWRREAEE